MEIHKNRENDSADYNIKTDNSDKDILIQIEKGYDLPISDKEISEAENECKKVMEIIKDTYIEAYKGESLNVVISGDTVRYMVKSVGEKGYLSIGSEPYSNMENFEQAEVFLANALNDVIGSIIIYQIYADGGIGRLKYTYDGSDMYVLFARCSWNNDNEAVLSYISNTRIKEWRYSENGWFCYELCVPEYPEVTEMVDGACLLRIKPITKENRELSEKYVFGLGYQGNNILCSNWNENQLEKLDYNGMFEYLYEIKYNNKFDIEKYPNGIPKEEFESLITEFIPITAEKLCEYAVYDEENHTYAWARLGCLNYSPTFFGTSIPEVTSVRDNNDGTVTLTVDAVCEMVLGNEAVITCELVIRIDKDGNFQYLRNQILDNGIDYIPDYQYRISKE